MDDTGHVQGRAKVNSPETYKHFPNECLSQLAEGRLMG